MTNLVNNHIRILAVFLAFSCLLAFSNASSLNIGAQNKRVENENDLIKADTTSAITASSTASTSSSTSTSKASTASSSTTKQSSTTTTATSTSTASSTKSSTPTSTASTTKTSTTTATSSSSKPTSTTTASSTKVSSTSSSTTSTSQSSSSTTKASSLTSSSSSKPSSTTTTASSSSTTKLSSPTTTSSSVTSSTSKQSSTSATASSSNPSSTSSGTQSASSSKASTTTTTVSSSKPSSTVTSTPRPTTTTTTARTTTTTYYTEYECNFDDTSCGVSIRDTSVLSLASQLQLNTRYTFTDFTSISKRAANNQFCQIPFVEAGTEYFHCKPRSGITECMTSSGYSTCSYGRFLSGKSRSTHMSYQTSAEISLFGLPNNQNYELRFYAFMYGEGNPAECQYATDYISVNVEDFYSGLNADEMRLQDFGPSGRWKQFSLHFRKSSSTPTLKFFVGRYSYHKCQVYFGIDEIKVVTTSPLTHPTGQVTNTPVPSRVSTKPNSAGQIFGSGSFVLLSLIASLLFSRL